VKAPKDIVDMPVKTLEDHIRSCGLYQSKAKNIKAACTLLYERFNSEVPDDRAVLVELPGVGRKTANVVVSNAFGQAAIAVDTHVFRVSNRLGLAHSENVLQTEKQLMKRLPEEIWSKTHHTLIFHGRRMCKARKPDCENCPVNTVCLFYKYKK
jgi:endonuclease-3